MRLLMKTPIMTYDSIAWIDGERSRKKIEQMC